MSSLYCRGVAAAMLCCLATCSARASPLADVPAASASRQLRAAQYEAIRDRLARCGENCLYLLARLHGHRIDYQQLLNKVDAVRKSDHNSTSLLDLCQVAESLGVPFVVRRYSAEEIDRIELPAIVHYRYSPAPGVSREKLTSVGHYVLAIEKDERGFRLIDGSTLILHHRSEDEFKPIWTGYVLVARKGKTVAGVSLTELGMIALTLGFWFGLWSVGRGRPVSRKVPSDRARRASRAVLVGMVVWVCLGLASRAAADQASADAEAGQLIWRTPENDGRNCLYLMLRLHRHPVTYERLAAALPTTDSGVTLTELRDAARRFGLNVKIAKRAPGNLPRDRFPVITHIDDGSPDGRGMFILLLRCSEEKSRFVDGRHVTYHTVSMDQFRRRWGGYVLEPAGPSLWKNSLISVGIGACILGLYLVIRQAKA